ncbi:anthrone oxygenase family protein [Dyadobacter psychrotolerans]|uniref:DUF1772 domain-containing protein n=1 Tax=Dyadobacter psychrotolerans TaxID=2541721 RepID=A0A4R5DT44_9BACT|nr:anthrone oxygenase family protein [Dyadobacter psychrotolerans]TDE17622.1 DUF1772 domain-containing protein [Dyadobacter psychrotolerans]
MTFSNLILIAAATTTALIAGLFYAWSCSVMVGMAQLPSPEFIKAMKVFNEAIQNPLFFASFMGTAILLPVCTYLHYDAPVPQRFWFLLVATVFYLGGTFAVTIFGNIPLNDMLASFDQQSASQHVIDSKRAAFELSWNRLNNIRAVSSVISVIMVIMACLSHKV